MKFSNKRQQFEGSNVSFNANTVVAKSYDRWTFLAKNELGKVIFNNSTYSMSTNRHQSKVKALMLKHGIIPDLTLYNTRESLTSGKALQSEVVNTNFRIKQLEIELSNPRRKKALDSDRQRVINSWKFHVFKVETYLLGSELNVSLN